MQLEWQNVNNYSYETIWRYDELDFACTKDGYSNKGEPKFM